MSNFVSAGTTEAPLTRDAEWHAAQAEIEAKHLAKAAAAQQQPGQSLFEVLQANKAAKQEAFEEAARLKNQYRALDDEEAGFLEGVFEREKLKEDAARKEEAEGVEGFRRRREEEERRAREGEAEAEGDAIREEVGVSKWVVRGTKRKAGNEELFKGVKVKKTVSSKDESKAVEAKKADRLQEADKVEKANETSKVGPPPKAAVLAKPAVLSQPVPLKPANALGLGLGYADSDEDD